MPAENNITYMVASRDTTKYRIRTITSSKEEAYKVWNTEYSKFKKRAKSVSKAILLVKLFDLTNKDIQMLEDSKTDIKVAAKNDLDIQRLVNKGDCLEYYEPEPTVDDLVETLEENEDMVECKECFELFPKVTGIRISKGYICPCCCDKPKQPDFDVNSISDADVFKIDFPEYDKFEDPDDLFAETEFPTEEDEFDPIMPNTFSELVDALIKDEFDAIDQYEDAKGKLNELTNLSQEDIDNLTKTVDHIIEEEKEHVEELQNVITKEVNTDENDPISDEVEPTEETLVESQAQEIGQTYKNLSKKFGFNVEDLVYGKDGFMNTKYPEGFPDFAGDVIYSEKYWNELVDFAKEKGLKLTEDLLSTFYDTGSLTKEELYDHLVNKCNTIDIDAGDQGYGLADTGSFSDGGYYSNSVISVEYDNGTFKACEIYMSDSGDDKEGDWEFETESFDELWNEILTIFKPIDLVEHVNRKEPAIESTQELKGTDNAVVDCKVADIITHSEDEKPVDCKGEKKPLEKPLTEVTHATMAKPEGDKAKAFNNALRYAKKNNVDYIYGYTNHTGKFFALDQPVKAADENAEKAFRNQYKNCKTVYRVYPDKSFIKEDLTVDDMNAVETYLRQPGTELEAEWIDSDGRYTDEVKMVLSYNPRLNKFILDEYKYHSSEDNNAEVGPDGYLTDMYSYKFDSLEEIYKCFPDELAKIFEWNDYKLILKENKLEEAFNKPIFYTHTAYGPYKINYFDGSFDARLKSQRIHYDPNMNVRIVKISEGEKPNYIRMTLGEFADLLDAEGIKYIGQNGRKSIPGEE